MQRRMTVRSIVACGVWAACLVLSPHTLCAESEWEDGHTFEEARVVRVIDGRTILVRMIDATGASADTRVITLAGVTIPSKRFEKMNWSAAKAYLKEVLPRGESIFFEREEGSEEWSRFLRSHPREVYCFDRKTSNDLFVNERMVREGFASFAPDDTNDSADVLEAAQEDARAHRRGIWKESTKN